MRAVVFSLFLFISTVAMAGAGGYTSETCVSASGRTVFTVLYTDFEEIEVNLIVDGVSAKYVGTKNGVSVVTGNDMLSVQKNGEPILLLSMNGSSKNSVLTMAKSADPRLNSAIAHKAAAQDLQIALTCKSFTEEP